MNVIIGFFRENHWIVPASFALIAFKVVIQSLHIDVTVLLKTFISEFKDLLQRKESLGAINALAIVAVSVVGVLILVAIEAKEYFFALVSMASGERLQQLQESASPWTLLICIALIAVASLVIVLLDKRR